MRAAFQPNQPDRTDARKVSAGTPEEQRATAASHLAHDTRNWLTVLRVYCDLLRSSGAVAGKGRTWIEELSNAVERGQGLVTSLLDSAQISGTLESSPVDETTAGSKALDLAAVLRSRQPLLQRLAGSRIRMDCKTPPRAETEALQEPEFDRILLNLVRNGIDAMPNGGQLTIELEPADEPHPNLLVLRVTDTGRGIPADVLPHIFDSGFSTKSAAQHPKSGRGYGLAIVRELALAAGGSVRVRSRMGLGTCFTVELPAGPAPATSRPVLSLPGKRVPPTKRPTRTLRRTRQPNNFDSVRKGTRVPC